MARRRDPPDDGARLDPRARILAAVRSIPPGRVSTYGRIAALADLPGRARLVGTCLRELPPREKDVPWHRVITASGRIALPSGSAACAAQRELLETEGVVFVNSRVPLARFGWPADKDLDALLWGPPRRILTVDRRGQSGPARLPCALSRAHYLGGAMAERYVVFSHGKDGEPWGSKIAAMAELARNEGFQVESVDYRGIDSAEDRVTRLLAFCKDLRGSLVLVGSSLGGHVSTAASSLLQARGLFLIAPAFYMPGYEIQTPKPANCPITIVHGWRDDIVPVDNSFRYAKEYHATLHVIDADHRMIDNIRDLNYYFEYFLIQMDKYT